MYFERKEDLSVYYFIKGLFETYSFVTVVDEFPVTELQIPTISVEASNIDSNRFELGNRFRIKNRVWYIEVFAKNKSQRDEFAYKILNELENNINVYDFDSGFPGQEVSLLTDLPFLGCLVPDTINMRIVRVAPELVDKMYYRAVVSFTAKFDRTL